MYIMARTIMISDEIYEALTKLKRGGESYTGVIARSIGIEKNKGSLLECAGLWQHMSDEEETAMKKVIADSRKNWRKVI